MYDHGSGEASWHPVIAGVVTGATTGGHTRWALALIGPAGSQCKSAAAKALGKAGP